ncbi:MAG TPA: 50S ribosomal protein L21 [Planctomycetota bacterium]|nr:50S ribosomal protein L21 [Planctomycetota bacterium]
MYAIIRDGGRQHRVAEGGIIVIDRVGLEPGQEVEFPEVLLYRGDDKVTVGTPTVEKAKVIGEVKGVVADRKVVSVQYRRRKNSRRKVGHRQKYTEVLIKSIVGPK